MDWLGWSGRAFLGALVGALLGAALVVRFGAAPHGVPLAASVGLLAGLFASALAEEKSALRGVLVATLAVWVAASADVVSRGAPLFSGLAHLHAAWSMRELLSHVLGAVLAVWLGGGSLKRGARRRVPGARSRGS